MAFSFLASISLLFSLSYHEVLWRLRIATRSAISFSHKTSSSSSALMLFLASERVSDISLELWYWFLASRMVSFLRLMMSVCVWWTVE